MRGRLLALSIVVVACGPRTSAPTRAPEPAPAPAKPSAAQGKAERAPIDISDDLGELVHRNGVPGLAAAVVDEHGIYAIGAAGVRRADEDDLLGVDDLFHLGSDTKAMTAFLLAREVDDGVLSWDTTIAEAFPDEVASMDPAYRTVTLEQLLRHRAGVPAELPSGLKVLSEIMADDDVVAQRRRLVHIVLSRPPAKPPGTAFEYSNQGYVIASAMLEARTGRSWEDLMRQLVFQPLHMASCGFGPTATGDTRGQTFAHAHHEGIYTPAEGDNPEFLGPAGTVHCTLRDWARFAWAQIEEPDDLLRPETWARLHRPTPIEGEDGGYALGWLVAEPPWAGGPVLTHDGSNTLNYASIIVVPGKRFAVVGASNAGDEKAQHAVVSAVTRLAQRMAKEL